MIFNVPSTKDIFFSFKMRIVNLLKINALQEGLETKIKCVNEKWRERLRLGGWNTKVEFKRGDMVR